jgi:polysaccharide biosynthesis protein VpsM
MLGFTKSYLGKMMIKTLLAVAISLASGQAFSEPAEKREPSFPVGPMVAYPIASLSYGYGNSANISNSGGTDGSDLANGSWYVTGSLGGGLRGISRGLPYGVEYEASAGSFDGSPDDDYIDQRLTAYAGHAFNIRNSIKGGVEYLDWHDYRAEENPRSGGRENIDGFDDKPDEWSQLQFGGSYTFGATNAKGRLTCSACETQRRYDNNNQEYRDYNVTDVGAEFAFRVSSKTDLLFGGVYSKFDYINENSSSTPSGYGASRDNEEYRYFTGVAWDVTKKSRLETRVGYIEKDYDSSAREDHSDFYWDVNGTWVPRGTTNLTLGFSRRIYEHTPFSETAGIATVEPNYVDYDYVLGDTLRAAWTEQWRPRISTTLAAYVGRDEYKPINRKDDLLGTTASINYQVNNWLGVGLNGFYRKRDSNWSEHDYEDSGVGLTLNLGSRLGGSFGWSGKAPQVCDLRSGIGSVWNTW